MGAVHRYHEQAGVARWEGVPVEAYADPTVAGVTKQVLIGPRDGATRFALRYFELAPDSRSALDEHTHDHGVLVLRGRGRVRLGEAVHEIGVGDVIYVAPAEVHQFESGPDAPLGFLCVVPPRPAAG